MSAGFEETISNGNGFSFNVTFDQNVVSSASNSIRSASPDFVAAFNTAIDFYLAHFTASIAINLNVGYGTVTDLNGSGTLHATDPGNTFPSILTLPSITNYASLRDALISHGNANNLSIYVPSSNPFFNKFDDISITSAEAKALGLANADQTTTDGAIVFDSSAATNFAYNQRAIASTQIDFIGAAEHEISEAMGRISDVTSSLKFTPLDLFRYTSPDNLATQSTSPAYFSIRDGNFEINRFNSGTSGDPGDWAGDTVDSFNAGAVKGQPLLVSDGDLVVMEALGYNLLPTSASPQVTSINFLAQNTTAIIADPVHFGGTVSGFIPGDTIDLQNSGPAASAILGQGNTLAVQEENGQTLNLQLDPEQDFSKNIFGLSPDKNGGTNLTVPFATTGTPAPVGLTGMNNAGGFYGTISTRPHIGEVETSGVTYIDGNYQANIAVTTEDQNGGGDLAITGMNAQGTVVGYGSARAGGGTSGGYFTASGGTVTSFYSYHTDSENPPPAYGPPVGISNAGIVVGNTMNAGYITNTNAESVVYITGPDGIGSFPITVGSFVAFSDPDATVSTSISGITLDGIIYGSFVDSAGTHGFIDNNGMFTTIDDPNAASGTEVLQANDNGQVAGSFTDASGSHDFIEQAGVFTTLANVSGAIGGITDQGVLFLGDSNGSIGLGTPAAMDAGAGSGGTGSGGTGTTGNSGSTPATVSSVDVSPETGDLGLNKTATITLNMTAPVFSAGGGVPELLLNDGGIATYDPITSAGAALVFDYAVAIGQNASALAITGVKLNGATVEDGYGNVADLSGAIASFPDLQVDTTPPTITAVEASPSAGTLAFGSEEQLTLQFSEPVSITGGIPTLTLNDGGTAVYDAASSTTSALALNYTVAAGQETTSLAITGISLNSGSVRIQDNAGNSADLSGVITSFSNLQVDATSLVLDGVTYTVNATTQLQGITGFALKNDANLKINAPITTNIDVDFQTQNNTLNIGHAPAAVESESAYVGPKIENFYAGNSIDISGGLFYFRSVQSISDTFDASSDLLQIDVLNLFGNVVESATLHVEFNAPVTGDPFRFTSDGGSGILITSDAVPCFCRGTRILTPDGEVAVEGLSVGDHVITSSGTSRRIRWIGHRSYDGRFIAGNRNVLPIRIQAGALAEGMPARDLWVSPEHALYIDDVLVPAAKLLNGSTVAQPEIVKQVEYWHIELDTHDIIIAEGAPAESFVDCDNRLMFANGHEFSGLYPDDERPSWQFCAPRLDRDAPHLAVIRSALLARAELLGYALDSDPELRLIVDGEIVVADKVGACVHRFCIAGGSRAVWLESRSTVPVDIGASGDLRHLGVPIESIVLHDGDISIEAYHGCPALNDGFHEDEPTHRWTDGRARVPETFLRPFPGDVTLDVRLIPSDLQYWCSGIEAAAPETARGRRYA